MPPSPAPKLSLKQSFARERCKTHGMFLFLHKRGRCCFAAPPPSTLSYFCFAFFKCHSHIFFAGALGAPGGARVREKQAKARPDHVAPALVSAPFSQIVRSRRLQTLLSDLSSFCECVTVCVFKGRQPVYRQKKNKIRYEPCRGLPVSLPLALCSII